MRSRLAAISILTTTSLFAHCDSLDGPVVEAARRALSSGDVHLVLPWVPAAQESAIREAFVRTTKVRALGADARKLADTWFFETLVRVHRAGEGAPYDGLKPAGAISGTLHAADEALAARDLGGLEKELSGALRKGLQERFTRALEAKQYATEDVAAGRKYVAAYVDFLHFAERAEKAVNEGGEHAH